jgi:ATP-dependent Clp protease, protease subunit
VKTFNFRPKKHRGAFSFKARISNLGIETDDPDELEDLIDDATEAGELDEDDPDNEGDNDLDAGEVVDLLIYSVVGDPGSLDPSDESNVTARAIATALRAAPNAKRINVHLNSEGGNVADSLAIYNNLTDHKAEVRTFVDGLALSSASLIAMGGDSVTMRRGALMMIHNPWSLAIGDGNAMRKQAQTLDKFQTAIASVYAEKTGLGLAEIKAMMDEETWMTAMQAKRMGFADAVRGRANVKPAGNGTNNLRIGGLVYNLSKYKNGAIAAAQTGSNLPIGQVKPSEVKADRGAIFSHMATAARAALGMKPEPSAGATSSKAARTAELGSDREAIHNRMVEVAKAALGKNFDEQKTDNSGNEKQAIQNHMARVAKAALG